MKKNAAIVGDVTSIEEVVAQIIARDPDLLAAVKQKIANTLEEIDITGSIYMKCQQAYNTLKRWFGGVIEWLRNLTGELSGKLCRAWGSLFRQMRGGVPCPC